MKKIYYTLLAFILSIAALTVGIKEEKDAHFFLKSNEWDVVCIFPPYTPAPTVKEIIGNYSNEEYQLSTTNTDAEFLLVFLKQRKLIKKFATLEIMAIF